MYNTRSSSKSHDFKVADIAEKYVVYGNLSVLLNKAPLKSNLLNGFVLHVAIYGIKWNIIVWWKEQWNVS